MAADVLADRNIYHGSDSWRMDDMVIPSPYKKRPRREQPVRPNKK